MQGKIISSASLVGSLSTNGSLLGAINGGGSFVGSLRGVISGDYDGSYSVTPTNQTQTLYTMNKTLTQNVVINPIPSNYGLITWDGSVLTVS